MGGLFTQVDGEHRTGIARLDHEGRVDPSLDVNQDLDNLGTFSLALQPNGGILLGGGFRYLNGQLHRALGRLYADGSLDSSFAADGQEAVFGLALLDDGKIVGGICSFAPFGNSIVRFNADGSLDASFPATADNIVRTIVRQSDGKLVLGGDFTILCGQARSGLGRLHADGTLDTTFNPGVDGGVSSLAVQTDGKILVGGGFTTMAGQSRLNLGRLNPDGSVDTTFDPGANSTVWSLAVQADGKVLVSGGFTELAGQSRSHFGRLTGGGVARQSLEIDADGRGIAWYRSGAGPEVEQVTFEYSADGTYYSLLGRPGRVVGGWRLTGLSLLSGQRFYLRARGRTTGGENSGSTGLIECVRHCYLTPPPQILSITRSSPGGPIHLRCRGIAGLAYTIEESPDLVDWVIRTNQTAGAGGLFEWSERVLPVTAARFYRLRYP
jgi:uncharacterized delta-60 repeat protein